MGTKHFELTDETMKFYGRTLHRIRCTKQFSPNIKIGDLGGWVEKEENLSDDAWVYDDAKVYDNAKVYGDARIYDDAEVLENAKVFGNARVSRSAKIYGDTRIYGDASITGRAEIFGNANVSGNARIYYNHKISGNVWIYANYGGLSADNFSITPGKTNQQNKNIIGSSKKDILDKVFKGGHYIFFRFDRRTIETKQILSAFTIEELQTIYIKKHERSRRKYTTPYQPIKDLAETISMFKRDDSYRKVLIEGNDHIWWASPIYGHNDYNKIRFGENNPKNRKRMKLINALLKKQPNKNSTQSSDI